VFSTGCSSIASGPTKYTGKPRNRQGTGKEGREQAGKARNRQRTGHEGREPASKAGNRQGRQGTGK